MVLFCTCAEFNYIMIQLQENISGISLGPTKLAFAAYADDISVVTSTK